MAALPRLAEIEHGYSDRLNVLSVINDMPANFEKGCRLLDDNSLTGDRLFRENDPLVGLMEIDAFPTYVLLDGDGRVIMKGSSVQALDWMEEQILR